MKQVEKNMTELWEEIEKFSNAPLNRTNVTALATYWNAYKALCMIHGEDELEAVPAVMSRTEITTYTPELDGDTEFERVIMSIPMDDEHLKRVFCILNDHLEALAVVRRNAVDTVLNRLREVAAS